MDANDATATFMHLAKVYGTFDVTTPSGTLEVFETSIDVRGAVVSERPGEGSFVELESFPVMTASAGVAAAFARHCETAEFATGLMALEDGVIRLVAIADLAHVYLDGSDVILDVDSIPMAA